MSATIFIGIVFCLALIVANSFAELFILRHPTTDNGNKRKLTCVSGDDDGALIWNYNFKNPDANSEKNIFTNVEPEQLPTNQVAECALWKSEQCLAKWETTGRWEVANSSIKPMGPVLDYRWENFREYVFANNIEHEQYQNVAVAKESSGTIVFSVRGSRDVYIFLCQKEKATEGPCFAIVIGSSKGTRSAIRTCSNGAPNALQPMEGGSCVDLVNATHRAEEIIHGYEWRTFTIKWSGVRGKIQIFRETDRENESFLETTDTKWSPVFHILIRSQLATRVRFHFYNYFRTEEMNSVISTVKFHPRKENLCIEMLVGLCPECKLNVSLINEKGYSLETWSISDNGKSLDNELLIWQSVKRSINLKPQVLKLEIRTILNNDGGKGQWAIDTFRTCNSLDEYRKSTVTTVRETSAGHSRWPEVNCQKLSYNESAVVDSLSEVTLQPGSKNLTNIVEELIKICGSTCENCRKNWSVCHSGGCTYNQRISCHEECPPGYYGYSCDKTCGRCNDSFCDKITGYCGAGCERNNLVPPLCQKELEKPIIVSVTHTSAKVLQKVELEKNVTNRLFLYIHEERVYLNATEFPIKSGLQWSYEVMITGLRPDRKYEAHTILEVRVGQQITTVQSSETEFQTIGTAPDVRELRATSVLTTEVYLEWKTVPQKTGYLKYNVTIKLDKLLGCEDNKKQTPTQKEIVTTVNDTKVSIDGLHPYANYTATVTAIVINSGESETVIFQTTETDIPTSAVSNLRLDDGNLTIRWDEPEDCTTITGPSKVKKLIFTGVSDSVRNWTDKRQTSYTQFPLRSNPASTFRLDPFTWYKVQVYVIRGNNLPENSAACRQVEWRTPPAVPPAVTNLTIMRADPDTNTISLQWTAPNPPNGDIESYQVSILQGKKVIAEKSIKVAEKGPNYEITLPSNLRAIDTQIQVSAINKDVTDPGAPSTVQIDPFLYFKVPGQPLNLTAHPQAHGIVNLTWSHPWISYHRIEKFAIRVKLLKSNLHNYKNRTLKFNCSASKERNEYFKELHLLTSTSYLISLNAININDSRSSPARVNISVPDGYAFVSGKDLQIKKKDKMIELKIPGVENATLNSIVSVNVTGFMRCAQKQSQTSSLTSEPTEWVVNQYNPEGKRSTSLPIDLNNGLKPNCSLQVEKTHITVVLKDGDFKSLANLTSPALSLIDEEQNDLPWLIISLVIVICVLLVCLLVVLLVCRRKRKGVPMEETYAAIFTLKRKKPTAENFMDSCNRQSSTPPPYDNTTEDDKLAHVYAVPFVSKSDAVSIKCFEDYAKEAAFNGELNSHYSTFPRGLTRPCDYGRLPENMPKNRNKNLIAYDDTRVILDKIPGDPYSDYINANYIQGYGEPKAYIATQGPKPNTINDFWRMIWQKKVLVICMLTNVIEDEQKMCEQYWPEIGTELKYGKITVSNTDHQVFADYTIRNFKLSYGQETRKVTHLHYTGWPDHGIPMYSQSLVTYLKKLVEILNGRGPVVVHCSAGDGRTGTIILCDMCIRQGIIEREINVKSVIEQMCKSRANMVNSPQQYLLAHVIITDSITYVPTHAPCTEILPKRIKALRKQLPSHLHRLNNTIWQERALHSFANNKLPELIQGSIEVVDNELYSSFDSESNYIGAVSVDGVRVKNQYLASRLPSSSGLPDFWRFVAEREIEMIIMLQQPDLRDTMYCDIMPGESILVPVPYIQIETKASHTEGKLFTIEKLVLTDTSEEEARPQPVTVLTCNGWGSGKEGKPPNVAALVSLWQTSENIPRKKGTTLVLCRDGVRACGLYLALSFLLERMAVEKECDVISAVRAVRRSRPEFVQRLEEFEYLYDAAVNYVECFETYANFS